MRFFYAHETDDFNYSPAIRLHYYVSLSLTGCFKNHSVDFIIKTIKNRLSVPGAILWFL